MDLDEIKKENRDTFDKMMKDMGYSATVESIREAIDKITDTTVQTGRVSVLRDFDNMCKADAFVGFSETEWSAIRRFFEFNKQISGWDR